MFRQADINTIRNEIDRFEAATRRHEADGLDKPGGTSYRMNSRASGAVRRASLDLSQALVDFRNRNG